MGGFNQDIEIDFKAPKDRSSIIKVITLLGKSFILKPINSFKAFNFVRSAYIRSKI